MIHSRKAVLKTHRNPLIKRVMNSALAEFIGRLLSILRNTKKGSLFDPSAFRVLRVPSCGPHFSMLLFRGGGGRE